MIWSDFGTDRLAMQVLAVWQNYDLRSELEDLSALIRDTAKDWRDVLLEFQVKVNKRYGASLCAGGSQSRIKDTANKFRWLTEKEDIANLRSRLQSGSQTVTMLTVTAMKYAAFNRKDIGELIGF
jgi:hypothetical protein